MHDRPAPSREQMQIMAEAAFAGLPAEFRSQLSDVVLEVEDFATPEQLESVNLDDRWQLSGLYQGEPLPDRSIWESGRMPPRIWLFREPLIAEWRATGVRMEDLVRHVVVHEAGHHFGYSDEDMHRLEDQAD
ncbi:metallopeptidase family protein [Qipengyuania sp. GH25]|uniref:Metallopeptidase family protein n=1 Tax=Qipengyuania pacifica TaxID=2860199 RepID=A0ABS7JDC6_9SPHN|nr:metallopeptidase family protein [Qipengyuania aerophila]MBX7488025.1 metallopeptidase family protein [Qipengyuania aerophila]